MIARRLTLRQPRSGFPPPTDPDDELLADRTIEAVYIPLPNHLHAHWTARAAEAGKHVLCEKPIAVNMNEAEDLVAVRNRTGVLIQEAFMVRSHPQWLKARDLVRSGRIGPLRAVTGFFSYFNDNPSNIRNIVQVGGGALMDIGCYLVTTARLLFEKEPARVFAAIERDPAMGTDRLTSITLDFGSGHAIGTCSTQLVPYQRVHALGTRGRIEFEIPFNVPPDRPRASFVDDGSDFFPLAPNGSSSVSATSTRFRAICFRKPCGRIDAGGAARGFGPEHEGDRRVVPLGGIGALGNAMKRTSSARISRRQALGRVARVGAGTLAALGGGLAFARADDQFGGVNPVSPPPDPRFARPPTWETQLKESGPQHLRLH